MNRSTPKSARIRLNNITSLMKIEAPIHDRMIIYLRKRDMTTVDNFKLILLRPDFPKVTI
jgi:hypothetical protein